MDLDCLAVDHTCLAHDVGGKAGQPKEYGKGQDGESKNLGTIAWRKKAAAQRGSGKRPVVEAAERTKV
jgi:hypothetical protein